jgi:hypothetical protein
MNGLCRLALVLLVAAGGAAPAAAQTVMLAPSEALACMTPPAAERGTPEYPPLALERKDEGTIRVELVFEQADAAPVLRVLSENYDSTMLAAVDRHVRRLRVPCQPAGAEPARIVMEFVFRPDDGRRVVALPPLDASEAERRRQAACLTRIEPGSKPEYPRKAMQDGEQGNFLVRLRFDDPTAPPAATFVAGRESGTLRRSLAAFLPGYRLPCLRGAPVALDVVFKFRLEGGDRVVINDMSLTRLVSAAKTMPLPARFDFNRMGCPFDVRVDYYQPYKDNITHSVGEARPERREFLAWLAGVQLRLADDQQLRVLGDRFTVSVPCATMDL